MSRSHWGVVVLIFIALLRTALAETPQTGTVHHESKTMAGTFVVTWPHPQEVKPRDVFKVFRNGKQLGEAMVLSVTREGVTIAPKAGFSGSMRVGDTVEFARHAEMPRNDPRSKMGGTTSNPMAGGTPLLVFAVDVTRDAMRNGLLRVSGRVRNQSGAGLTDVVLTWVLWEASEPTAADKITGEAVTMGAGYTSYPTSIGNLAADEVREFEILTTIGAPDRIDVASHTLSLVMKGDPLSLTNARQMQFGFKATAVGPPSPKATK